MENNKVIEEGKEYDVIEWQKQAGSMIESGRRVIG